MDDLVAKALHAARQHFDEGGFLDSLRSMFSGPDYQSTGEVASPTNWGDPESAADFFRADKARMAAERAPDAVAPLTIPRLDRVEGRDLAPPAIAAPAPAPTQIPFDAPKTGMTMSEAPQMASFASQPLAFAPAPEKNPARAAIEEATKLTARAPTEPSGADNVWTRMLKQESGGRQFDRNGRTVTSPAGALGISQVMPSTGPEAARMAGMPWDLNRLRTDQEYNHALGRAYYDAQLARFGDPILAAAAYNGGPGRVAQALRQAQATGRPWTDFLKPETQNYVRVVGRAEGGEIHGDEHMTHDDIVAHALHRLRRHFDGSDGSYVDPMGGVAYGDNTDYRDVPGYGAVETASQKMGGVGGIIGRDLMHLGSETERLAKIPQQVFSGERIIDPTAMSDADISDMAGLAGFAAPGAMAAGPTAENAVILGSGPVRGKITKSADLPSIRNLPVDEAIKIARKEQHLIPTEPGNPNSGFIGGPRDVANKRQLNALRNNFDEYIGADPRGGDWYDRYRAAVNEVTGGDPRANAWMAAQQGQWSAGVSPQSELAFTLKENNASIAGMPVKAARPAQFEAHNRAIEMKDPNEMQLGKKTGEYARLINPDQLVPPGATGVNDFRHARNFNYTEAGGDAQRAALTGTQHSFLDYETALAVDRAKKANLAGRSDWTGEQLQAAPWVRQKALDILEQRPAIFERHLAEQLALAKATGLEGDAAMASATSQAKKLAYEEAFQDANSTIADFYDKHTAFATHEAQPGSVTQHLPGSVNASQEQRNAFAADPRSSWAFAPGGRDAIYSGLGIPDTGVYMRVRPTKPMQGMYETPAGVLETNPGEVARPLVAFNSGKAKSVPEADRALLNAGEATRAYIDAQNAGAWHKPWAGGADSLSTSYFLPMNRPATVEELTKLRGSLAPHGLGDVLDTGQGITATSFYPGAPELSRKTRAEVERAIELARPEGSTGAQRVKIEPGVDTGYLSYEKEFANRGSGDATRELLKNVNQTPEIRAAFNRNADIPKKALANLERDEAWTQHWGVTSEDIQRSRRIIGEGPGWVDRLEQALKDGVILPAIGAALLAPLAGQQDNGG